MTTILVDFASFGDLNPIPGEDRPTAVLTTRRRCDRMTIEEDLSETRCDKHVYVDPRLLDWENWWPVHGQPVYCQDCMP
jgi:hypothetical protein